jgi:hypothetical protein
MLAFPVLSFSQNLVRRRESMSEITHCTRIALRKGFYEGLLLVDEQGRRFNVTGARKLRTLPPRLTFGNILDFIGGNPRYEIELMFAPGPPTTISLEDARKLIFDSFRNEKYLWEAMVDFEEFRDKITRATSLQQVFSIFKEYHV